MYPYHCNSRTHSIVIASHDFQLQTDLNANWSNFYCNISLDLPDIFRVYIEIIFIDYFSNVCLGLCQIQRATRRINTVHPSAKRLHVPCVAAQYRAWALPLDGRNRHQAV